ncbi:hypothetical protein [Chthonobacter rhizosphaerae]|uniref:hypothetical protein n=1 Tax=Chthonobacter rhizosphaerae TaxID=2735553 RepID=UPI0015EFAB6F|nr:hypothetical protein [Chthonobacter rhizosphaerae]
MTGPHRAAVSPAERTFPDDPAKTRLDPAPPNNDPDLDEDGLPKGPGSNPDAERLRKGIHTDD